MDHSTPNLPSRNFELTSLFYRSFGFNEVWRDQGWMILTRGNLTLEFFPHPELDPAQSWFSCCLRVNDLAALYKTIVAAGVPEQRNGQPRLSPPTIEPSGLTIAYMIDPDGTLLRLIQNKPLASLRTF